eukprot:TRINITY_DN4599_c0_g1_i1.p1 TRINITY_DN4599_c0_g1~~TRINITY_DN4599_c0_g1_i1.p1  ORF type:complete len:140 (+),score=19.68 TRINITY_DN4599_c0_g1_i1:23-442(+)
MDRGEQRRNQQKFKPKKFQPKVFGVKPSRKNLPSNQKRYESEDSDDSEDTEVKVDDNQLSNLIGETKEMQVSRCFFCSYMVREGDEGAHPKQKKEQNIDDFIMSVETKKSVQKGTVQKILEPRKRDDELDNFLDKVKIQ